MRIEEACGIHFTTFLKLQTCFLLFKIPSNSKWSTQIMFSQQTCSILSRWDHERGTNPAFCKLVHVYERVQKISFSFFDWTSHRKTCHPSMV